MHKKYRTRLRQARRRINQIYKENKEVLPARTNELTQDKKAAVYFLAYADLFAAIQVHYQLQQKVLKSQKR